MDEDEGLDFAVRGVVRDGQVVIESPLDVPDGTFVTISPYRTGDIPGLMTEPARMTDEQKRWFEEDAAWLRARAAGRGAGTEAEPEAA
jgi:hypothetical protein